LPVQTPEARVLVYGYNSTVAFSKSFAEVDDFSRDFLHRVKGARQSTQEKARPMFFICHSLGGILFKQALNLAHQCPEDYQDMLEKFTGVVFMGTPHAGSDVALWASYAGRLLHAASFGTRTNIGLLEVLRKDSGFLGELSRTFALQNKSLRIINFYETEKFPMLNVRVCNH
jgi:protein SERAC1